MDRQAQIEALKQNGLDKRLLDNLPLFKQKFVRLKELLNHLPTKKNITEAYFLFDFIFDTVPLMVNQLCSGFIYRAQPNIPNQVFKTQSRISYNTICPDKIPFGKFNIPEEAMFYESLPYECTKQEDYLSPHEVAAYECCKNLKVNPQNLIQDITVGRWQIHEKINVVNLCFDAVHLEYNSELKNANIDYIENIKSCYSLEVIEYIVSLLEYFSKLCRIGSNEKAYYILTAFFDAIRTYYSKNDNIIVQGIISPSAITDGKGLNIVLLPTVVDDNLYLDSVCMYRYYLMSNIKTEYVIYPITDTVINYDHETDFNYIFNYYLEVTPRYLSMKINDRFKSKVFS